MARLDTLLKRLRDIGAARPYERVQTGNGCETMTPTQAYRYRQLQDSRVERKRDRRRHRSHYSLKEAARLLRSEPDEILLSAAAARLQCCIMAEGLRGHWQTTGHGALRPPPQSAALPKYLALCPADCRQIAAYGGVNVWELEYPAGAAPEGGALPGAARFILREPVWVDRKRIVLRHPLPE